jgi:hypothetical protein
MIQDGFEVGMLIMGRWGTELYQSDSALDYQSLITDRLERELAYWLSPEQVINESWWLANVLAVIEIILLFEQYKIGSNVYLQKKRAVQRWRETFFGIWDGDWQDSRPENYSFSDSESRKHYRPAVIEMFDALEKIAHFWENPKRSDSLRGLLPSVYAPPYLSMRRWANRHNIEIVQIQRFTGELIEQLVKDIIYSLSPEQRWEAWFRNEDVWVAVDILGFLCETYERTPGVNEQVVRTWRITVIEIWKQLLAEDHHNLDESEALYQNVMHKFDMLEAVARKFPPDEW